MKNFKGLLLTFALLFAFVLGGCGSDTKDNATPKKSSETKVEITISKENGAEQLASKKIVVKGEANLLEVMKENFEVKENGGMVSALEGTEQDMKANKFWFFEVNGENAMKGANETTVKPGDKVKWDLHEFKQ